MALGSVVMVPLTNPASAEGLMAHAVAVARADGGVVLPLTVVPSGAPGAVRDDASALVVAAEEVVRDWGVASRGLVVECDDVADGVLDAAAEHGATLVVMGWRGRSTNRNVFGELIDTVVGRSRTPMAVVRLGQRPTEHLLVPLSDDHLQPAGEGGVRLAAELARRLAGQRPHRIRVLRTGAADADLPEVVAALSDRVHHDPRRYAMAIGAAADEDDLVVVPVAPTASGLRTATTHVAWRAPEATLVVAIDVGPQPEDATASTASAGQPAPAEYAEGGAGTSEHVVVVTARLDAVEAAPREELGRALSSIGIVGRIEAWKDDEGQRCVRARVHLPAESSNDALALAMTALHEAERLRGAELRYDIAEDPATSA